MVSLRAERQISIAHYKRKPKSRSHLLLSRSLAWTQNWLPCLSSQPLPIQPPRSCHKHMYIKSRIKTGKLSRLYNIYIVEFLLQASYLAEAATLHNSSHFILTGNYETSRGRSKFCGIQIWGYFDEGRLNSKLVNICLG